MYLRSCFRQRESVLGYSHWVMSTLLKEENLNSEHYKYSIERMRAVPAACDGLARLNGQSTSQSDGQFLRQSVRWSNSQTDSHSIRQSVILQPLGQTDIQSLKLSLRQRARQTVTKTVRHSVILTNSQSPSQIDRQTVTHTD